MLLPYSYIASQVIKHTNLFILRNQKAYEFTDSLGIPRDKTVMIYKGVDLAKFKPKQKPVFSKNTGSLIFVGQLHEDKGLITLVKAFTSLVKAFPKLVKGC